MFLIIFRATRAPSFEWSMHSTTFPKAPSPRVHTISSTENRKLELETQHWRSETLPFGCFTAWCYIALFSYTTITGFLNTCIQLNAKFVTLTKKISKPKKKIKSTGPNTSASKLMFGNKNQTTRVWERQSVNNSRKKRYIFYTSRSQHVSTVIDEVTLAIILNTPGSFPAVMAPPLHRNRRNPPSHQ